MAVLILLIIAAVIFGFVGLFEAVPRGERWPNGAVSLGLCALAIALAIWHSGH